ncbi:hypothetical protein NQS96_00935 [Pseudoalteromonas shioyasakiensis]|uniref:hypothetical protein n=1 Tax=Pseudoalteromonas shioyasakiensis TaxID=1190813 RepID=UPI00211918E6|nr:hypothetical protein [Pseudoalteromonas shioyasakiensis]MCQ8880362.1 hypothetical protein [Pseudoalteromonas shioyasakiensis]
MASFQNAFIFIESLLFVGYGMFGLLTDKIRVGSRSYTGSISTTYKHQEPVRFYFWCCLFLFAGCGGFYYLFVY